MPGQKLQNQAIIRNDLPVPKLGFALFPHFQIQYLESMALLISRISMDTGVKISDVCHRKFCTYYVHWFSLVSA